MLKKELHLSFPNAPIGNLVSGSTEFPTNAFGNDMWWWLNSLLRWLPFQTTSLLYHYHSEIAIRGISYGLLPTQHIMNPTEDFSPIV